MCRFTHISFLDDWSQLTYFSSTSFVETCPVLALFFAPFGLISIVFVFWTFGLLSLFLFHSSSLSSTACLFHHASLTRGSPSLTIISSLSYPSRCQHELIKFLYHFYFLLLFYSRMGVSSAFLGNQLCHTLF